MSADIHTDLEGDKQVSWGVITLIIVLVLALVIWLVVSGETEEEVIIAPIVPAVVIEKVVEPEPIVEPVIEAISEVLPTPEDLDVVPVKPELPKLDNSDSLIVDKLPEITWRKELLTLLVTEDAVRRFVVFTDNFAQGNLSYDHSPFIVPVERFYVTEKVTESNDEHLWQWDEESTRRFNLYVDLLRSIDSGELVSLYVEIKPLIDQAYQELGYPDEDFTDVLQSAIIRVLDMDISNEPLHLTRPSVMYKYQDEDLEALDDADKLLMRIGKENLLVIKSVLLEINDKLSRAKNG